MIITKKYAMQLARAGKAELTTCEGEPVTVSHDGRRYQHVTRLDVERVDHYLIECIKRYDPFQSA